MKNETKILFIVLALVLAGCGSKKASQAKEATLRFQLAQDLLVKGQATQAMSELLKAEKLNPEDPEIQNLLGLAYINRGMPVEAEKHLQKAVTLDPEFASAHNHMCALLIDRERYDEAITHCSKAVENVTYATPERAYHNMGIAYERKQEPDKAVKAYRDGLRHNSNFVMSRKSLAMIYLERKQYPAAVKELETAGKACIASPKGSWGEVCPESFYRLGMAYVKLRQKPKAIKALKDCLKAGEEGTYGKKCRTNLDVLE